MSRRRARAPESIVHVAHPVLRSGEDVQISRVTGFHKATLEDGQCVGQRERVEDARQTELVYQPTPVQRLFSAERFAPVDRVLTLFPFEDAIYAKAGIAATFVGHPLADSIPMVPDRADARAQLRLPASASAIALLPGSRVPELRHHADLMIDTAKRLYAAHPEVRFFVPLATRETRDHFEARLYAREAAELPLTILFGHARLALQAADVALIASGTATLEAALARCPMVITYRVPRLTYRIMKRKALQPWFGLPNILAGEFIVPELIQDDATAENLSQALSNWLENKVARERLAVRFARIHESLAQGNDERVANALMPYLTAKAAHAEHAHHDAPGLAALRSR